MSDKYGTVLVTGASGFVGQALVKSLATLRYKVIAFTRRDVSYFKKLDSVITTIKELDVNTNLTSYLEGVDVIVHCAAKAHDMDERKLLSQDAYRRINTAATLNLASQAAKSGVTRFVFISTIKVNGEKTVIEDGFREEISSIPEDPYAQSKWEAEEGLKQIAKDTGMEIVIIRPPLVYGPGVKGNFAVMMKWATKSIPLPFGSIQNKRSLLALENLISFIILCIEHQKAANQTFVISDGDDVSTTELLRRIAKAQNKVIKLVPIPAFMLKLFARLIGKQDAFNRLLGSLVIDSIKARSTLGWKPVVSMQEQLTKMIHQNNS